MSQPLASPCYTADCPPVIARGVIYSDTQLDELLGGPVKSILQDTAGIDALKALLAGVATTDFEQRGLEMLLQAGGVPEGWFVGEAVAETFIAGERCCIFPWPGTRDLRNPEASPAGADLTGFQNTGSAENPYRFAFGEVKTSEEAQWPPQVMYGRTGLKQQLEDLKDSQPTKQALVKYLAHHATNATWREMFISAVKRYLSSGEQDVIIFGVLVRDVEPKANDLSYRASALAKKCSAPTNIELYALYLPGNSIPNLAKRALAASHAGELK